MDKLEIKEAANKANGYNMFCKETKAEPFNEGFMQGAIWMSDKFKWVDIADCKPEEFKTIVLHNAQKDKTVIGYYVESIDRFFRNNERAGNFFNVTHWMYLPELL